VLAVGADDLPIGFTDGAVVDQGIEVLLYFPLLTVVTVHNIGHPKWCRRWCVASPFLRRCKRSSASLFYLIQ
jgi:hypothetical protein